MNQDARIQLILVRTWVNESTFGDFGLTGVLLHLVSAFYGPGSEQLIFSAALVLRSVMFCIAALSFCAK